MQQLDGLRSEAEPARAAQQETGIDDGLGLRIEFESFPDIELAFESLARERPGIELFEFAPRRTSKSSLILLQRIRSTFVFLKLEVGEDITDKLSLRCVRIQRVADRRERRIAKWYGRTGGIRE